jgi:hypothetical protein
MMRTMAQKMLGDRIPPEELEASLPELIRTASADMPDFGFDDGDDFFSFGPPDFFERDPFWGGHSSTEDLFQIQPFQVELDTDLLQQFRQRLASQVEINLKEMLRLNF